MNEINSECRNTDTHVYFWNGIYSQWSRSKFTEDGIEYPNAEFYMMYHKARVFNAVDIQSEMIKNKYNPKTVKALGRKIKNFTDSIWDEHKMEIVTQASYLKFTQNKNLLNQLLREQHLELVEASPVDKIWGIGLHYDDDKVLDKSNWNGQNLLGKCIMNAREQIINEEIK